MTIQELQKVSELIGKDAEAKAADRYAEQAIAFVMASTDRALQEIERQRQAFLAEVRS